MSDAIETTYSPAADLKNTPHRKEELPVIPLGRTPPHDLAAEQGVLGCILLDTRQNLPECIEKVKDESVFYDLRHQAIYATMVEMFASNDPIDILTLSHQLRAAGEFDNIGGVAYLTQLQDSVPSAANLEYYFDIVRERGLLRRMIQTCTQAISDAYEESGEVERLIGEVEQAVLAINNDHNIADTPDIKDHVTKAIETIEIKIPNQ